MLCNNLKKKISIVPSLPCRNILLIAPNELFTINYLLVILFIIFHSCEFAEVLRAEVAQDSDPSQSRQEGTGDHERSTR